MSLNNEIIDIRKKLKNNEFNSANEQSISLGIVLRLLHALDWPKYETQIVIPEKGGSWLAPPCCYLPKVRPVAAWEMSLSVTAQ